MLNGLIDSREVRREKAAGSSRSSGAASQQSSWQGTVNNTRLQEVIAQRDAYYQKWFASHQEQMSQHYANVVQQYMQVSLSDHTFSCIETKDNTEYL
jgi:septum formation topological specificity factor MinE